jgi:hypothetical protein
LNDTDRGRLKYSQKKMSLCHYTSYMNRPGTKPAAITRGLPKDSNKYLEITINRVNFVFFYFTLLYSLGKGDAGGIHKYIIRGEAELYLQHSNIRLRQNSSYTVQSTRYSF